MSKLNHLYNAEENALCYQTHQKWVYNFIKSQFEYTVVSDLFNLFSTYDVLLKAFVQT